MVLKNPPILSSRLIEATISLDVAGTKQNFRLLNPTRIGRSPESHIRLGGASILPRHAVITFSDGKWFIQAESHAGMIEVNDKPTRSATLSEGDVIAIGGVSISFHLGPFSSQVPPSLASLPQDPTDPRRAVITELARRQTQIDLNRAEYDADREAWFGRLAAEKKLIEDRRRAAEERIFAAERGLTAQRLRFESESTQARLDLASRQREIEGAQRDLAESLKRLAADREAVVRARRESEKTRQTEEDASRRSLRAAARLIQKNQRDQAELERRAEAIKNEESRLEQTRSRIERQLEVRAHELAGIGRRIDNERLLLADLQRRRIAGETVSMGTASELAVHTAPVAEVDQLEQMAFTVEGMVSQLEANAGQLEIGNRRIAEERRRLLHLSRHLDQRKKELDECERVKIGPRMTEIERREKALTDREGKLTTAKQVFDAERSAWLVERAAWEESKLAEQASIRDEWDIITAKRTRLVLHHRQRMERFRRTREEIRQEKRRVLVRIGELMRREAHLEILRHEIGALQLAKAEEDIRRSGESDPLNPAIAEARQAALERRRQCEERWSNYEVRLTQSLDWIEREIIAGRTITSNDLAGTRAEEVERLRATLSVLRMDQAHRMKSWEEERRQYQRELVNVRGELESMAVSYLEPGIGEAA